eukprot:TRINITY_DN24310_c0_g1_i1.p1 TRINITY_DN24310_c0_g1~~TRINITY_DN24310_c0_g1_i1.p1  ORF type:complete len:609 (+),score=107.82 TRINITY_DN24310_c0_g1_i1:47-1828(+)
MDAMTSQTVTPEMVTIADPSALSEVLCDKLCHRMEAMLIQHETNLLKVLQAQPWRSAPLRERTPPTTGSEGLIGKTLPTRCVQKPAGDVSQHPDHVMGPEDAAKQSNLASITEPEKRVAVARNAEEDMGTVSIVSQKPGASSTSFLPATAGAQSMAPRKRLFDSKKIQDTTPVDQELYDVSKMYHTSGVIQRVVRSNIFANITLLVIALNAVWIGIEADNNKEDNLYKSHLVYIVVENIFAFFFSIEISMRFLAFKHKRDCLRDFWFVFDGGLVALMAADAWIISPGTFIMETATPVPTAPLKMLRLLRLTRLIRLMRSMPELLTLINGLRAATSAVASSLLLTIFLIYTFGVIILVTVADVTAPGLEELETLPRVMWTLVLKGTLLDDTGVLLTGMRDQGHWVPLIAFVVFTTLSCITVLNMLVGILVEVVAVVKAQDEEMFQIDLLKSTLLVMLKTIDADGSGRLDKDEIAQAIDDPSVISALREVKVDPVYFLDLLEMHFEEEGSTVSIEFVMNEILHCRGEQKLTYSLLQHAMNKALWELKADISHYAKLNVDITQESTTMCLAPCAQGTGYEACQEGEEKVIEKIFGV